ncbi:MAG: hypothetical protein WCJ49_08810, partial [Deltaproteobacteria bacterium]
MIFTIFMPLKQGKMIAEEEAFLQQILQERDRFFRETSKLKSQLDSYENFESERASYKQQIDQKDATIARLKQQLEMLQRKIWGKSSEKHINGDPQQRCFDFEGLDLLPEEKELATSAKEEIEQYKTIRVPVKEKTHPVRKPLPESLPREECHIYPDFPGLDKWTELEPEVTEVLE